ncbi:MAG: hypothetical protein KKD90_06780 [Candidatus Omnitrophica bacterium]|nr:hypothetical protein [Candidatus Omnitrophota bacterium]MBU3912270.1 hypothetical protein [Candidatus Omnitrophota bacterium]MBU4149654.1 hypothetical protein [Candidatus Omnitrophota bacterium]
MSIINDAIKKARKEFEIKNKGAATTCVLNEETCLPEKSQEANSEIKWTVTVTVSLVVIISLLGSLALYRHISRAGTGYDPAIRDLKSKVSPSGFNLPAHKQAFHGATIQNAIELNGIVHGPEGKWAIINDKIVREGDSFLDGKVTVIAKDFVRIEKDDGEEIVLNLK